MPLKNGNSQAVIQANYSELRKSGFPEKQAWAIAMKKSRKQKKNKDKK